MKKSAAKIITIFSCKGGVGKTTTTLNLAGIYSLLNKKVLIMDFDLNGGGIAVSLNIDNNKTIYNVVDDMSNNRFSEITDYVSKYNDNIYVLPSPKDPRNALKVDSKYINLVIASAIYKYDVILIDTSHSLNPISLTAMDDPVDLKNARSMISIFTDTEKDNYKVLFNASKDTGKDYFSLFDVKTIIKHNIDYLIDKTFYIKDIDKYVIDGEILTLNKKIRLSRKKDIINLTRLAEALLENKRVKKDDKEGEINA